jgi:hypothetical protein
MHSWNYGVPRPVLPHLQPAQDDDEQPPQPELLEELEDGMLEDLPIPKRDISLPVFFEPHFSQATSEFDRKTSFSKSVPQALQ